MFEQLNPLAFSVLVSALTVIPEDPGVSTFALWMIGLALFGVVFLIIYLADAWMVRRGERE